MTVQEFAAYSCFRELKGTYHHIRNTWGKLDKNLKAQLMNQLIDALLLIQKEYPTCVESKWFSDMATEWKAVKDFVAGTSTTLPSHV